MPNDLLFPLAREWEVVPLSVAASRGGGDVQTGPFGSQLHAADYVVTGIPSVMPQNIGDNRISSAGIARITERDAIRLEKHRLRKGDIVYSRRGDVERRALIREENDGWLCVRQKGSHRQYHHVSKPGTVTVAGRPSIEVPPGTLNSILKQAGLKK